ncbi:MAG TPA: hypothetical protein VND93_23685 [Myxococcales bacterium]|nr:hypothetical protein [Myxococcales bacterium]
MDRAGASAPSGALPPGHPSIDDPGQGPSSGELPPGHPSLDSASPPGPAALPPGHPAMREGAAPPSADELLKRLDSQPDLRARDKSFEVAVAVGKLYYASARYPEAAEYLGQAWPKSERARQLYAQQKKKAGAPAPPPAGCEPSRELKSLTEEMEKRAAAGDAAGAAGCGAVAMAPVLEAEEMRANALALTGDYKGAASGYERALQLDARRDGSLYGHAMALVESRPDDVAALKAAKADLGAVLGGAAPSPHADAARHTSERLDRAIAAGGLSRLVAQEAQERKAKGPPKTPPFVAAAMAGQGQGPGPGPGPSQSQGPNQGPTPEQIRQMEEAARNMPRTPEVEAGFAQLVEQGEDNLAHGRWQEALDAYKRVVPFQPENGRAKAGMAWAMVGLNRQPMADRVWTVAVSSDPAAVEKLGDALKQKGDEKGARALWSKLRSSAPGYAASSGLDRKLN